MIISVITVAKLVIYSNIKLEAIGKFFIFRLQNFFLEIKIVFFYSPIIRNRRSETARLNR